MGHIFRYWSMLNRGWRETRVEKSLWWTSGLNRLWWWYVIHRTLYVNTEHCTLFTKRKLHLILYQYTEHSIGATICNFIIKIFFLVFQLLINICPRFLSLHYVQIYMYMYILYIDYRFMTILEQGKVGVLTPKGGQNFFGRAKGGQISLHAGRGSHKFFACAKGGHKKLKTPITDRQPPS